MQSRGGNESISIHSEDTEMMDHFLQKRQVGLIDSTAHAFCSKTGLMDLIIEFE